jgi:Protein of unknown function (DUF3179)
VWKAVADGRALRFRLIGINNQNFVMEDEETGSWWQQITGAAMFGPLAGTRLELVFHEELAFGTWRGETRSARVLRPEEHIAAAGKYATADWEEHTARYPVPHAPAGDAGLPPRTLVVGVEAGGASKAFPLERLRQARVILDQVGAVPVAVWLGPDGRSVRVFGRTVDDRVLDFVAAEDDTLRDLATGSSWSFTGAATSGPLAGEQLEKIYLLVEYWFDWKTYHPDTAVQR